MNTLLLTAGEQKIFQSLPGSLQEGWTVTEQGTLSQETVAQLALRLKMARFNDPTLQNVVETLKAGMNSASLEQAASSVDLTKLSSEQLAELFFVLGIGVLNAMIAALLKRATTDEDVEGLSGLTQIRSLLSEANSSHS
jgi:hypothetical protein